MVKQLKYDFSNAGFNAFMVRSIASNPNVQTLADLMLLHPMNNINFDQQQVSGSMGDKFNVGAILIDGVLVRIDGNDPSGNPVWRLGNLGD